jgi:hypothetical protein
MSKGLRSAYAFQVIEKFLLEHWGVPSVGLIRPYGRGTLPSYLVTACTEAAACDLEAHVTGSTWCPLHPNAFAKRQGQPALPVQQNGIALKHDLTSVAIYATIITHYVNTTGERVDVRINFENQYLNQHANTSEVDTVYEAMGGRERVCVTLEPTGPEGVDVQAQPVYSLPAFGFHNDWFMQTMWHIDDANLLNGVLVIPADVCEAAGLPIWRGIVDPPMEALERELGRMGFDKTTDQGQAVLQNLSASYTKQATKMVEECSYRNSHYVAVPADHVLSWGCQSQSYLREHGANHVYPFDISKKTEGGEQILTLYYLIGSGLFDRMHADFRMRLLNKIDKRNLAECGVELIPADKANGLVKLRMFMSFVSAPPVQEEVRLKLAPARSPNFVQPHAWSNEEMQLQSAARQFGQTKLKKNEERK